MIDWSFFQNNIKDNDKESWPKYHLIRLRISEMYVIIDLLSMLQGGSKMSIAQGVREEFISYPKSSGSTSIGHPAFSKAAIPYQSFKLDPSMTWKYIDLLSWSLRYYFRCWLPVSNWASRCLRQAHRWLFHLKEYKSSKRCKIVNAHLSNRLWSFSRGPRALMWSSSPIPGDLHLVCHWMERLEHE